MLKVIIPYKQLPHFLNSINIILFIAVAAAVFTSVLAIIKLASTDKGPVFPSLESGTIAQSPIGPVYEVSPFLLPVTWGAVFGILVWKGRTKSRWTRQGYDYDVFKVVARMRGSPMRIRLLNSITSGPKNKLQLAKELNVDWKTVDDHIKMLQRHRLVRELAQEGNSKYYIISEHGKRVLSLLSDGGHDAASRGAENKGRP